jgi:hypothetical protein
VPLPIQESIALHEGEPPAAFHPLPKSALDEPLKMNFENGLILKACQWHLQVIRDLWQKHGDDRVV